MNKTKLLVDSSTGLRIFLNCTFLYYLNNYLLFHTMALSYQSCVCRSVCRGRGKKRRVCDS